MILILIVNVDSPICIYRNFHDHIDVCADIEEEG